MFLAKKYFNYLYTYGRIASEHKIAFLERFSKEFNESYEKGEFDDTMLSAQNMSVLKRIMKNPTQFYYEDTMWTLNVKHTALADELGYYLEELEKRHGKSN